MLRIVTSLLLLTTLGVAVAMASSEPIVQQSETPSEFAKRRGQASRETIRRAIASPTRGAPSGAPNDPDAWPKDFLAELRGLAEGTDLSTDKLLLLQPLSLPNAESLASYVGPDCTDRRSLLVVPDTFPTASALPFVVYRPKEGRPYVLLTSPGSVFGQAGMNDMGIAISLGSDGPAMQSERFSVQAGLLLRETLRQSQSLDQAATLLEGNVPDGVRFHIIDGKAPEKREIPARPNDERESNKPVSKSAISLRQALESGEPRTVVFQPSSQRWWIGGKGLAAKGWDLQQLLAGREARLGEDDLEPLQKGTVTPDRDEPDDQPDLYQLARDDFTYEIETDGVESGILRSKVRFPSPVTTQHPENNTVHGELFRPYGPGPFPCVIVLHITGGDFELSRFLCRILGRCGVASMFVKMPYYGERRPKTGRVRMVSKDLDRGLRAMRQTVLDLRRACDLIETMPSMDGRIGITGVSLGGIAGALTASLEPRIDRSCLILAGGDFGDLLYESQEREAREFSKIWQGRGGTRESFNEVMAPYDPLTYASRLRGRKVLMLNASKDESVPTKCGIKLWERAGKPPIVWYPCGHYTIAWHFPDVSWKMAEFFAAWDENRSEPEATLELRR
ncbi:Alpha/beta hydrolase family protein [Planctomycetes bacterium Pan216]|uniref:Alpha/beta hydrolase family protein n=1 Tax=Kolteria novifilia TaxID=2527975 RepID=A0A518B9S4_9BACT|nr:Alpha/beta hydrolase family protein [Planctomycetes bacterium Pan216]